MSDLVGHQLGQYAVTAQIGKGGMATVYRATQASMKRSVAIKVLPRTLTHEERFLERFYREVEIVASLQHPHILPVYDFGEYDGMPYIVMAYMNGGTLADLIGQGPMDSLETIRIVQEMADALDYAHSKGVIHRDFKPNNVLLDEKHNTYLTDFGLAKMSEGDSHLTGTSILGTPSYMAPEQADSNLLTPAADVYALGVTIFQMLTGRVPYDAATPMGMLMAHVTQPIPYIHRIRPELPEETQDVIDRSMAKKVDARFTTPSALSEALTYALRTAIKELGTAPAEVSNTALLMTNMIGQVIFLDQPCLRLLKRRQNDARSIIGKPLSDVLGISREQTETLMQQIAKTGQVSQQSMDIKDSSGIVMSIWCSASATRDDKGAFVGADITLQPVLDSIRPASDSSQRRNVLDSTEETFLQTYFVKQMSALRNSLVQMGGPRIGRNLDRIVNETAERNVWAVNMSEGTIQVGMNQADVDNYRALLAKGMAYGVNLVGKKMVMKGMQSVDKQFDERMLNVVKELRLYELFDVL
jgi:serine/threonine protein kinase